MRASIAAVAAMAGGLLLLPAAQGPASATSAPINLKNVIGSTAPGSRQPAAALPPLVHLVKTYHVGADGRIDIGPIATLDDPSKE